VAEHFPAAAGALITGLEETRRATQASWRSSPPKIGHPVTWRDHFGIEVSRDDLVDDNRRGRAAEYDRHLRELGVALERDEWFTTPQGRQGPQQRQGERDALSPQPSCGCHSSTAKPMTRPIYGAIVAIIGQGIGPGADDQGAKFGGGGNLPELVDERSSGAVRQTRRGPHCALRRLLRDLRRPSRRRAPPRCGSPRPDPVIARDRSEAQDTGSPALFRRRASPGVPRDRPGRATALRWRGPGFRRTSGRARGRMR
jgi:hypothetical protein